MAHFYITYTVLVRFRSRSAPALSSAKESTSQHGGHVICLPEDDPYIRAITVAQPSRRIDEVHDNVDALLPYSKSRDFEEPED